MEPVATDKKKVTYQDNESAASICYIHQPEYIQYLNPLRVIWHACVRVLFCHAYSNCTKNGGNGTITEINVHTE
jgi:hypothetical protein